MKLLNKYLTTGEPVGWQKARALSRLCLRAYVPLALFWCLARWPLIAMGWTWLAYPVDAVLVFPWRAGSWLLGVHVWDKWTVAYVFQFVWLSMLFFIWLPMCAIAVLWKLWKACEFLAPRAR